MMSAMQQISKRERIAEGPTQDFLELVDELYGGVVDGEAVWAEVFKRSADSADAAASSQRSAAVRRNVERGSNGVGIAAGTLGLAGSLKDDRLAEGTGRIARGLAATGRKMPSLAERVKNPKFRAAMAATAVGTQVANLGGDALIAGTLKDSAPKGNVRKVNPARIASHLKSTGVKAPLPPKAPKAPTPPTPPKAATSAPSANAGEPQVSRAQAAGAATRRDLNTMLGTRSGKVAAAAVGANAVSDLGARRRQAVYDPYVGKKADFDLEFAGTFSKFDDDKRQAFGWASMVTRDGQPVIDRQGDYISIEDLETAAYSYVHKSRVGGDMHRRDGEAAHKVSDMIESVVFTPDKIAKMGLPEGFPEGWWVGYQIHDDATWELVRKRGRTGFSIHGKGVREDTEIDDLMGYRR